MQSSKKIHLPHFCPFWTLSWQGIPFLRKILKAQVGNTHTHTYQLILITHVMQSSKNSYKSTTFRVMLNAVLARHTLSEHVFICCFYNSHQWACVCWFMWTCGPSKDRRKSASKTTSFFNHGPGKASVFVNMHLRKKKKLYNCTYTIGAHVATHAEYVQALARCSSSATWSRTDLVNMSLQLAPRRPPKNHCKSAKCLHFL